LKKSFPAPVQFVVPLKVNLPDCRGQLLQLLSPAPKRLSASPEMFVVMFAPNAT
jgi:hypothetical protein